MHTKIDTEKGALYFQGYGNIDLNGPLESVCRWAFYRGPGWYKYGKGTTLLMTHLRERLIQEGWRPYGRGRPIPPEYDVLIGPTGTYHPGGPGVRTRIYAGRWVRPRAQQEAAA
jgi:hypothetical protein